MADTEKTRLVIQGALASILAEPNREQALALLPRLDKLAAGFVSDRDFIDLLRVYELTLHLGRLQAADCPVWPSGLPENFLQASRRLIAI